MSLPMWSHHSQQADRTGHPRSHGRAGEAPDRACAALVLVAVEDARQGWREYTDRMETTPVMCVWCLAAIKTLW